MIYFKISHASFLRITHPKNSVRSPRPVSYTHLTLPTNREVIAKLFVIPECLYWEYGFFKQLELDSRSESLQE